jgi:capsular exopolysaccharide synthesis family protein
VTKVFEAIRQRHLQSSGSKEGGSERTFSNDGTAVPIEETMISLYQSIESLLPPPKRWVIQFVGSREGEGTSTIVKEFARVSAVKLGKKVLVIDADRLKPTQSLLFKVPLEHPLQDVLSGAIPLEKALYPVADSNLSLSRLATGSTSAPEVFDNPLMGELWERLRHDFDLVVIDTPPITVLPDCLAISSRVDGIILVVEAEGTRWPIVEMVKQLIRKNNGNILGMVLNKRQYYIPEWIYKRL